MATGTTAKDRRPHAEGGSRAVLQYDEFVDRQLSRVRSQIKSSDIGWSLMMLVAGAVGFLLALIVIDHWLIGLGRPGRLLALAVLVIGVTMFLVRRLVPLVIRRISPAYAALVVERSEPSLKNSLLNLILFRGQKHRLREVVYHAVEQQAATGLTHVDIETSVDRAPLVRMAGALALIVSVAALYAVLSPKSSFQTVARVMAPWRDIPRPSRVTIRDVQPGTTQVFAGRGLEVSAIVERLAEDESVWLVYSTADQQELDRRLSMQNSEDGVRVTARLPAGTGGIYQDVDYHLEAGDAIAGPYRVKVLPAPSIVVDQITYDFPQYTGLPAETIPGHGDIVALEGTRVTIEASANQGIRSAEIEFNPESHRDDAPGRPRYARKTLAMKVDGRQAQVSFTLALAEDRQTPLYDSYWLKLVTMDGGTNDQPVVHRIEVRPDLSPLVEILTPERREITLPVDGRQPLEVRAVDPDFQLRTLELVAVTGGDERWRHSLLPENSPGQVVRQVDFQPRSLGFKAGETVIYWAVAADNREDAVTASPAPNMTRTDRYVIRITGPANPDEAAEPRRGPGQPGAEGEPAASDEPNPAGETNDGEAATDESRDADGGEDAGGGTDAGGGEKTGGGEAEEGSGQIEGGETGRSNEQPDGGEQEGEAGDQSRGEAGGEAGGEAAGEPGSEPQGDRGTESEGEGGSPSDADGTAAGGGAENGSSGSEDSSGNEADGQSGAMGDRNDATGAGQDQGSSSEVASDAPRSDERQSEGEAGSGEPQTGAGAEADQSGEGGEQPSTDQQKSSSDGRSGTQPGADPGESMRPDAGTDPLPNDGSRDADAFERILDRMKERTGEDQEGREASGEQDAEMAPDDRQDPQTPDGTQPPSQRPSPNAGAEAPSGGQPNEGEQPESTTGEQSPREAGGEEPSSGDQGEQAESPDGQPASPQPGETRPSKAADRATEDGEPAAQSESETPESDLPHSECTCNNTGQCSHCQGQAEGSGEAGDGQAGRTDKAAENGESGQSTESGESDQSGDSGQTGEKSDQERMAADGEPRDSGSEAGASQQQPADRGEGDQANDAPGDPAATGSPGDQSAGGSATGHDRQAGGEVAASEDEPGGDDPNLEYARRATQMALEYLKDQQDNPDQELLEELGWQPDDVQKFLARWQQLQQEAPDVSDKQPPENRELEDALRSLGLYPDRDRLRRAGTRASKPGGAVESGARSRPPTEYLEAYRAYLRSKSDTDQIE